ncbi:MAG: autotransporter-associated beta strand repeat-containing protein [Pirellulales bacterium]
MQRFKAGRRGRGRLRKIVSTMTALALIFNLVVAPRQLSAVEVTWTGAGPDGHWSSSGNWTPSAPSAADLLLFTDNLQLNAENDLPLGSLFDGITFRNGAGAFTLSGNAISLGGDIINSSLNRQTINLDLVLQQNVSVNAALGDIVIGGAISGSGVGITKLGAGVLTLSGPNSYGGTTTINDGILRAGAVNALSAGSAVSFANVTGATLDLNGFNNTVASLAGGGTFGGNVVLGSATLTVDTSTNTTYAGVISGTGGLIKQGSGTLTLSGNSTYTGPTVINAGTLKSATSNTSMLGGSTRVTVNALGTLDISGQQLTIDSLNGSGLVTNSLATSRNFTVGNNNGSGVFSGIISGAMTFTKGGTGTQVLSGANTYTGPTNVNNGVLSISSLNSIVGIVASSSFGAPTTVANGTIGLGNAANTGTLRYTGGGETTDRVVNLRGTTGGAVLDHSGTGLLKFTSSFTATGAGIKTLTLQGSTAGIGEIGAAIINNSAANTTAVTKLGTGAWILSGANTYTGTTTVNNGSLTLAATGTLASTAPLTFTGPGTFVRVDPGAGNNQSFGLLTASNGDASLQSAYGASGTASLTFANYVRSVGGAPNLVYSGGTFSGASPTNKIVFTQIAGAAPSSGFINQGTYVNSADYAYYDAVVGYARAPIYGTDANFSTSVGGTTLGINSASTHVLLSAANVTAQTTASVATLKISSATARNIVLGASQTLTIAGGGILRTGGAASTISGGAGGGITTTAGTELVIRTDSAADTITISAPLALSNTNAITKTGPGTLIISNANNVYTTVTGVTTVAGGTLQIGGNGLPTTAALVVHAGATFSMNGAGQSVTAISGAGTVTNGSATARTLTINGNANLTFSGLIQNGGAGTVGVSVAGGASQTLTGLNTYTGNTVIQNAVLTVNNLADGGQPSAIGAASNAAASFTLANNANGGTLTYNGTGSSTDRLFTISSTSSTTTPTINANGSGVLSFTNTGAIGQKTGGTLSSLNLSGTSAATIINTFAPQLTDNTAAAQAFNLNKIGANTWRIAGTNNTYTGVTTVGAGILQIASITDGGIAGSIGQATNAAANIVLNGGTLQYVGTSAATTDRLFSVGSTATAVALDASGSAAIKFINPGLLSFTNIAAVTFTLAGSSTADNTLASAIVDGPGSTNVAKSGLGTWVLSGANTYGGTTTVNAGILNVQSNQALGTSIGTTVAAGATLQLQSNSGLALGAGGSPSVVPVTISGTGAAGAGGAIHNLSGNNQLLGNLTVGANASIGIAAGSLTLGQSAGSITLAAGNLTLNGPAGTGIIAAQITGFGSLIVAGGNWQINAASNASNFVGGTVVSGGNLALNAANVLPATGSVTVAGGALDLGSNNQSIGTLTAAGGRIIGTGTLTATSIDAQSGTIAVSLGDNAATSLTKSTADTLTLAAANTFAGATSVFNGSLRLAHSLALQNSTLSTGGVVFDSSVTSRAFTVGGLGGSGIVSLQNNAGSPESITLYVGNNNADTSFFGNLEGAGGLTKIGVGTLSLAGSNNTYTGPTIVSGGTLLVNGGFPGFSSGLSNSAVTVQAVGTLGGTGIIGGSVTVNDGGTLQPGLTGLSSGTLNIGSLLLGTSPLGGQLNFRVGGFGNDLLNINGALSIVGGVINLTSLGGLSATSYTLLTYGSFGSGSLTNLKLGATSLVLGGFAASLDTSTFGIVRLNLTSTLNLVWNGAPGGGVWNTTTAEWTGDSTIYTDGAIVTFGDTGAGTIAIAGPVAPKSVAFNNSFGNDYTLTGAAINDNSTPTVLIKSGGGTLSILNANGFSGGVTLNEGTLGIGNSLALGVGTLNIAAAGVFVNAAGASPVTFGNNVSAPNSFNIAGSQALTFGGSLNLSGGNVTTTINNTAATNFTTVSAAGTNWILQGSGNVNVTGSVALGAGGLSYNGGGVLTLGGANTYTGTTTFGSGIVVVSSDTNLGNGGGLIFAGGTLQTASTFSSARGATFNFGGATIDVASGNTLTLGGHLAGVGGLVKLSGGTLALADGTNNYSGATTISAGTLQAGAAGAFSSNSYFGVTTGAVLDLNGYNNTVLSLSGGGSVMLGVGTLTTGDVFNAQFDGTITGAGSLIKQGSGTFTLTGTNGYLGGTTINGGALKISSAANLGALSGAVAINAGTLEVAGTFATTRNFILGGTTSAVQVDFGNTYTIDGTISDVGGSGKLNATGFGNLVLTGQNTYAGDTAISGGTLTIAGANTTILGATGGNVSVSGGGILSLTQASPQTIGGLNLGQGTVSGTGALIVGNTLNVGSGASFINALVNLNAGVPAVFAAASSLTIQSAGFTTAGTTGTFTIAAGGQLVLDPGAGQSLTITRPFSITGSVAAPAIVNTSGDNTISAAITFVTAAAPTLLADGGTLTIASLAAVPGGVILSGSGSGRINGAISGNATVGITKSGVGTWTLLGANARTTGTTAINAGILNIQHSQALGTLGGAGLTTVAAGATLQLQHAAGIAVGTVGTPTGRPLSINGDGAAGAIAAVENVGGNNSLLGNITVAGNSSAAAVDGILTLGQAASTLALGANTLTLKGSGGSGIVAAQITGSGAVTLASGAWQLNAPNTASTYSGGTNVTGGVLTFNAANVLPIAGNLSVSGGTVQFAAHNQTVATLTIGGGTVATAAALTGNSVNVTGGGKLLLDAGGTLTSTNTVHVGSGGILTGQGVVSAATNVQVETAGIITAGNQSPSTSFLSLAGGLTFGDSGTLNVARLADGANAEYLAVGGTLTAGGVAGQVVVNVGLSNTSYVVGQSYKILSWNNYSGPALSLSPLATNGAFSLGTITLAALQSASLVATSTSGGGELQLVISGDSLIWTGGASTTWAGNSDLNWKLSSNSNPSAHVEGAAILFQDAPLGSVVNVTGNVTPGNLNFHNATTTYTLQGSGLIAGGVTAFFNGAGTVDVNSGVIGITGGLVLNAGRLNLHAAQSFSGGVTINGSAILQAANVGALGSGNGNAVVFGGGSIGKLQLNNNSLTISGLSTNVGAPGTPVVENAGNGAATLIVSPVAATTFAGVLQDGSGGGTLALSISGGTLVLAGANTYSGATSIGSGTLQLALGGSLPSGVGKGNVVLDGGATAAGTLDLNGVSATINGLLGASDAVLGQVVNNATGTTATLTLGNANVSASFAGLLKNNTVGTGVLAVSKIGSGTQTLSGINSFTGGLAVSGGTLATSGDNVNILGATSNAVTIETGATLNLGNTSAQTIGTLSLLGGAVTGTGALTINTSLSVSAGGTISTINAPLTLASAAVGSIAAGAQLSILTSNFNTTGSGAITIAAGGQLILDPGVGNSVTIARTLNTTGNGVGASGVVRSVSGSNFLTGAISSAASTSTFQVDSGLLTISGNITGAAGGGIVFTGAGNGVYSGNFSGNTGQPLVKSGTGTWTFTGTNGRTGGGANINAGILNIQNSQALGVTTATGTGLTTVAAGGTLQLQHPTGLVVGLAGTPAVRPISINGGGAANAAAAVESISGVNALLGNITIAGNASISVAADSLTLGQSTGTFTLGANLLTLGGAGSGSIAAPITGTTGGISKIGTGTWSITAAANYSGATTISGGTLAVTSTGSLANSGGIIVAAATTLDVAGTITGGALVQTAGIVRVNGALGDATTTLTVQSAGALTGAGGTVHGTTTVQSGGAIAPGGGSPGVTHDVGTLNLTGSVSSLILETDSLFYFDFHDAAGSTPGTDWDLVNLVGGGLLVNATAADPVVIRLGADAGATNFNPSSAYSWKFLDADNVSLFSSDSLESRFVFEEGGLFGVGAPFAGQRPGGEFAPSNFYISQVNNDLYINYAAVPEPGSLLFVSLAFAAWYLGRRRPTERKTDAETAVAHGALS